jgi:hypothetical protein
MYNNILSFFKKMSTSNAAAIRRRTNLPQTVDAKLQQQQTQQPPVNNMNSQGLTLPQVIAVVDKRLLNLETFMKDTKETLKNVPSSSDAESQQQQQQQQFQFEPIPKEVFNTIVQEFNNRFEILAYEINNIKDMLLKLQTYTMDVNKILLEERSSLTDIGSANLTISNIGNDLDNTEYETQENIQLTPEDSTQ